MITLDAAMLRERLPAHDYLKEALSLPDHYGKNLDALYDCLTELEETEIHFVHSDAAEDSYYTKVRALFLQAQEANPKLHLCFD